jgi:IS30 family transposase
MDATSSNRSHHREPWSKGKLIGQKAPFKPKDILALRVPRARSRGRRKHFVTADVMLASRPVEVQTREVPGHWEGDLIVGVESSAIGTLVARASRFTVLLHLPRMSGHGQART